MLDCLSIHGDKRLIIVQFLIRWLSRNTALVWNRSCRCGKNKKWPAVISAKEYCHIYFHQWPNLVRQCYLWYERVKSLDKVAIQFSMYHDVVGLWLRCWQWNFSYLWLWLSHIALYIRKPNLLIVVYTKPYPWRGLRVQAHTNTKQYATHSFIRMVSRYLPKQRKEIFNIRSMVSDIMALPTAKLRIFVEG